MSEVDLARIPLAARVTAQMRDDFIHQVLKPGAKLSENALVARYAVSRTPIREALRTLESEGVVERTGPGSIAVPLMTSADARQLYQACAVLEGLAARSVASSLSPEVELAFARCLRAMASAAAAGDRPLVLSVDAEFHAILARYSSNTYLLRFLRSVHTPLNRYRLFNEEHDPHRAATAVAEHQRLFQVLTGGDPDAAQHAFEQHVLDHLDRLLAHLSD
jgi:DNA-binding GntR family transcriptional regulator